MAILVALLVVPAALAEGCRHHLQQLRDLEEDALPQAAALVSVLTIVSASETRMRPLLVGCMLAAGQRAGGMKLQVQVQEQGQVIVSSVEGQGQAVMVHLRQHPSLVDVPLVPAPHWVEARGWALRVAWGLLGQLLVGLGEGYPLAAAPRPLLACCLAPEVLSWAGGDEMFHACSLLIDMLALLCCNSPSARLPSAPLYYSFPQTVRVGLPLHVLLLSLIQVVRQA